MENPPSFFASLLATPWFWPAVVAGGVAIATAGFGSWATVLGPWYYGLRQPSWKPPDWAFGLIWTIIFGLTSTAAVLAWMAAPTPGWQRCVVALFALNALLNAAWSVFYFKLQRPDWALWEVAALWLSVLLLVVGVYPLSALASVLLLPYLLWVSIAAALNRATVRLNGPFGPEASHPA